jgi:hypothetical protein
LDGEKMRGLNGAVGLEREDREDVASEPLDGEGIIE